MIEILKQQLSRSETYKEWFQTQCASNTFDSESPLGRDEWSLREVIEHLVLVEEAVIPLMQRASTPVARQGILGTLRFHLVQFVMKNGIKVPVPSERVLPSGVSLPTLLQRWDTIRSLMRSCYESQSEETLKFRGMNHPIAGDLTVAQAAAVISNHLYYHQLRTKRLLKRL